MDTKQSWKAKLRGLPSLKGPFRDTNLDALPDTPREAFELWLEDAIAEKIKEPHALTLSTVDEQGQPDARVVILKNIDERGWHFAVKADSAKGQQLVANSHVALTFYWPQLGRQVRMRGKATELTNAECAEDFLDRPIGSRVSALASKQSQVLQSPAELSNSLADAERFVKANPQHVAPDWKVYAVMPTIAEFWQGATDRLHKRLQYVHATEAGTWEKRKLWP